MLLKNLTEMFANSVQTDLSIAIEIGNFIIPDMYFERLSFTHFKIEITINTAMI